VGGHRAAIMFVLAVEEIRLSGFEQEAGFRTAAVAAAAAEAARALGDDVSRRAHRLTRLWIERLQLVV